MQTKINKILGGLLDKIGLYQVLKSIGAEKMANKFSAAVVYAVFSSFALNFFYQPGHVYASGATGAAQVVSELVTRISGHDILPLLEKDIKPSDIMTKEAFENAIIVDLVH